MKLIDRTKNILFAPTKEWAVIDTENGSSPKILTNYLIWLVLIPVVAGLIGYGLIGYRVLGVRVASFTYGVKFAVQQLITIIGGIYVSALVFDLVGPKYGVAKNFDRKFALVAYSYTATCVGGIFYLIPGLRWLASLASLYSFYLLWTGFKPMTGIEEEKKTTYFVISLLVMLAAWLIISLVLGAIMGLSASLY